MPRLARVFSAAAVLLWGVAITAIWAPVDEQLLPLDRTGAAVLTVLAGTRWMLHRMRDRDKDADKDALVYALADITLRRGLARTQPLKRVV